MTTTHIKNLSIISLDADGTIHTDADLVIDGGIIKHIGRLPEGFEADEVLDGYNRAAMPGFFNAHSHSPMTFERGWAEDLPFDRWLNEKIWVAESALTPDDVFWGAALAACEMIRSGTVAFNDHYFYMNRVTDVVRESGMRAALTWCVFGIGEEAEVGVGLEGSIEWIKSVQADNNERIRTFLGPHSPYICPPDFLERIVEVAHEMGQGIHIHLSETDDQVIQSIERYGVSPVRHLEQLGVFDVPGGCIAAHALAIDVRDTRTLTQKNVSVAHCPITYMKLAMPFPALESRLNAGINVCLGTDGPGSNSDMDMFAVIRQTVLMEKYQSLNPEALPADTALRMATQAGATAMGFKDAGRLEEGAPADFIMVNLDVPHMRPEHSLIANLVHSAKGADVTDVMVDGKWLMRKRELQTLDEEKILAEAHENALKMVNRGMQQMREYKS